MMTCVYFITLLCALRQIPPRVSPVRPCLSPSHRTSSKIPPPSHPPTVPYLHAVALIHSGLSHIPFTRCKRLLGIFPQKNFHECTVKAGQRHIEMTVLSVFLLHFHLLQYLLANTGCLNHLSLGKVAFQATILHAVHAFTPMRSSSVKSLFNKQVALTLKCRANRSTSLRAIGRRPFLQQRVVTPAA